MKKSKVIIPALAVLVLSTAASVTGTVAWFTANRTATLTAGEFAVVNTNSNLAVTLNNGIGVTTPNNTTVTQKPNHTLTDSSFDHTDTTCPVIVPDSSRTIVDEKVAFDSYSEANFLRSGAVDDTGTKAGVYSAFAWDITFSIQFPAGAVYDMGIFLDIGASYVHEKVTFPAGHVYTSDEAAETYYALPDCTGDATELTAGASAGSAQTLYKETPDATGKGFRLAFIPKTTNSANDLAYTKVWAENQIGANTTFIDNPTLDAAMPNGVAYAKETTKMTGAAPSSNVRSAETLSAAKVLIASNVNHTDPVPADHTQTHATSLASNANYLAFLKLNAGATSSVTFTCLAWYEGTDPEIVAAATDFEKVVVGMKFAAVELSAAA